MKLFRRRIPGKQTPTRSKNEIVKILDTERIMHTYTHDRVHVSKILKIKAFACNYIVCSCQAAMPCNRVNMEVCAVELNRRSVDERMSEYDNT